MYCIPAGKIGKKTGVNESVFFAGACRFNRKHSPSLLFYRFCLLDYNVRVWGDKRRRIVNVFDKELMNKNPAFIENQKLTETNFIQVRQNLALKKFRQFFLILYSFTKINMRARFLSIHKLVGRLIQKPFVTFHGISSTNDIESF